MSDDVEAACAGARAHNAGARLCRITLTRLRRTTPKWIPVVCAAWLMSGCTANLPIEPIYLERGDRITVSGNALRHYRCIGQLAFICQGTPGRLASRDCVCQ